MLTFILTCVACAFFITVLYNQFNEPEGLLFGVPLFLDKFFKGHLTQLSKPLYSCMICMSSFWGGIYFYILSRLFAPEYGLLEVVCAIPVIGGMLTLISIYYFMKEIDGDFRN